MSCVNIFTVIKRVEEDILDLQEDLEIKRVEEDILDLQEDLERIVVEVWDAVNERVQEKGFNVFRRHLTCGIYEPHFANFLRDILELPSVKSIDDLFARIIPCINFVDIGLLIKLVNIKYLRIGSVKSKVDKYKKKLVKFRETSVAIVIHALERSKLHLRRKPEGQLHLRRKLKGQVYKEIVERLALDPNKCSLEYLNKLCIDHIKKLKERSRLKSPLMVFNSVDTGSVVVTWLIRAKEASFFEKMFDYFISEGIFLDQYSIVDIQFNGRVFQTMERVSHLYTSKSLTSKSLYMTCI